MIRLDYEETIDPDDNAITVVVTTNNGDVVETGVYTDEIATLSWLARYVTLEEARKKPEAAGHRVELPEL